MDLKEELMTSCVTCQEDCECKTCTAKCVDLSKQFTCKVVKNCIIYRERE